MCIPSKLSSGSVQLNSSTATQIVAARGSRKRLRLAFGSGPIYVGDSAVTVSNGYPLGGDLREAEIETSDSLYGISASGTPTISFLETYD